MITLVLTNRNRDLRIIKNCLDSLYYQTDTDFECFLVDYGSHEQYLSQLESLLINYPEIIYIPCPTSGQLWNKSRAINIALKKATHPFFVVGDIDLIFHTQYIQILKSIANDNTVYYFQFGFLSQLESLKIKEFSAYEVAFKGDEAVTGNTMFPTSVLKSIRGFDEFYHGWGAEDTDAHIRMQHLGLSVVFFKEQILVKHQWHPKEYRSKKSSFPFHSQLERINHAYMVQTQKTKRTIVNQNQKWGHLPIVATYNSLRFPTTTIVVSSSEHQVKALLGQLNNFTNEVIRIEIIEAGKKEKFKNRIKKQLGKKYVPFYKMKQINDLLLEEIIKNFRNYPYDLLFDQKSNNIILVINLSE